METARALARAMAANDIGLGMLPPFSTPFYFPYAALSSYTMLTRRIVIVYGGGTVGLMGEVAKTLVSLSGPDAVHGVIPEALVKYERDSTYKSTLKNGEGSAEVLDVPEQQVFGRTTVVKDMHTRKQMMAQEVLAGGPGSGFIALAGGYGTMEELLETATWNQLGIHHKGIVVLNTNGYYDGLLEWVRNSASEGFIKGANANIIVEAKTAEDAIKALKEYKVSESQLKLSWGNQ